MAIADRLDGKPIQESNVNITKRDAVDWTLVNWTPSSRRRGCRQRRNAGRSILAGIELLIASTEYTFRTLTDGRASLSDKPNH